MSDDLLSKMTSALAEEHDGATAAPEATRSRVVRTLAERKPRRRKWMALGIPAFFIFGGSTAWAAATGHLPEIVDRAVAVFAQEEKEPVAARSHESQPRMSGETPQAQPRVKEEPPPAPEAAPAPEVVDSVAPSPPTARRAPSSPRVPVSNQSAKPDSSKSDSPKFDSLKEDHSDLLTYREAHRAHFQNGDCPGAVRGYRKYLREQPAGSFALEAKYNLGVCLIRLGQTGEAKALLAPFAAGAYGDYRREKAQELIDAL